MDGVVYFLDANQDNEVGYLGFGYDENPKLSQFNDIYFYTFFLFYHRVCPN